MNNYLTMTDKVCIGYIKYERGIDYEYGKGPVGDLCTVIACWNRCPRNAYQIIWINDKLHIKFTKDSDELVFVRYKNFQNVWHMSEQLPTTDHFTQLLPKEFTNYKFSPFDHRLLEILRGGVLPPNDSHKLVVRIHL